MAALTTIAIATAAAALVGGTVSQTVEANKERKSQEHLQERMISEQQQAEQKADTQALQDKATVEANLARDRQRLMARRARSSNRYGTIATSPLGILGSPSGGQKTALGA